MAFSERVATRPSTDTPALQLSHGVIREGGVTDRFTSPFRQFR